MTQDAVVTKVFPNGMAEVVEHAARRAEATAAIVKAVFFRMR